MVSRARLMGLNGPKVSNLRFVVNLQKSHGSYVFSDTHGKKLLDMFGNISSLPLGYNHPRILNAVRDHTYLVAQRQANGVFPALEHRSLLRGTLTRILPQGFCSETSFIHTDQSGSCAVENMVKCLYARILREGKSTDIPLISFEGGFHGRTLGSLSLTHSNKLHKDGFPTIHTQKARIPLADDSKDEVASCLDEMEDLLSNEVAGVIVEPVQAEGGDRYPHSDFLRVVRNICKSRSVPFIVDEVQTGLYGTGLLWGYEHHNLDYPPDGLIFSKRTQIPGFFAKSWLTPSFDYQCFNTWMGDTIFGVILEEILNEIEEKNLIQNMAECGRILRDGLEVHPSTRNVRGLSTFLAFDVDERDAFVRRAENSGIVVGSCGDTSIRLRPPLNLSPEECFKFLELLP